jgi:hypothetical protein
VRFFKVISISIFLLFSNCIIAQDSLKIKELRKKITSSKRTYEKALAHCVIAEEYENFSSDSCLVHAEAAKSIANKEVKGDTATEWESIYYKADFFSACYYGTRRTKDKMFQNYFDGYRLAEQANDLKFIAKIGTNLGIELLVEGKQCMLAQKFITLANEAAIKTNDPKLLVKTQSGLAYFYQSIGEYKKSLAYFKANAKYLKDVDVDFSVLTYISIGRSFIALNQPDSAIYYLNRTLKNYQSLKLEFYTASLRIYLARAYLNINQTQKAIDALYLSIHLFNKNNNIIWPESYLYLGEAYDKLNKKDSAQYYYQKAIDQSIKVQNNKSLSDAYFGLSEVLTAKGLSKEAYTNLMLHLALSEDLGTNKQKSEILRNDLIFDHNKKSYQDSILHEHQSKEEKLKLTEQQSISETNNTERITLIGVLVLLITVIIYGSYSFIKRNKQNKIISAQRNRSEQQLIVSNEQKKQLEEQNKEIEKSLRYAERIQKNMLPSKHFLGSFKDQSFVLFKPQHIISSDFYCFVNKGKYKIIALINCEEKGVPGTLSSIMIFNQLNTLLRQEFTNNINDILKKLNEILIDKNLQQNKINVGILCINSDYEMQFKGYNINLYLQNEGKAKIVSGVSNALGDSKFKSVAQNFQLKENDKLLLFSPNCMKQLQNHQISEERLLEIFAINNQAGSTILNFRDTILNYLTSNQREDICAIGIEI